MHPLVSPSASHALAIRVNPGNPNHHLWRNHGVWWIHYVVHEGHKKRRVRTSLGTRDLAAARAARDVVLASFQPGASRHPDFQIVAQMVQRCCAAAIAEFHPSGA